MINLSADKDRVIAEAFRVLKPGGRFAVSDVVVTGDDIPAEVRRSIELWVGCVAGALEERVYRSKLASAGFESIDVEPARIYRAADARQFLEEAGLSDDGTIAQIDGRIISAFVHARKPAAIARSCCRTDVLLVITATEKKPLQPWLNGAGTATRRHVGDVGKWRAGSRSRGTG